MVWVTDAKTIETMLFKYIDQMSVKQLEDLKTLIQTRENELKIGVK